jgi:signal transduction histidine kinase
MTHTYDQNRVQQIYSQRYYVFAKNTDRMFAGLLLFEWILGIVFSLWLSPSTWIGEQSQVHLHVYAAITLGGIIASLPIAMVWSNAGASVNRMVIAVSQMLFSVLLIHLTGGRIETHFHIFGSLAFLAFYRDWRPVLIATVVTAADHFLRGHFWPQSVYGVLSASPWRAIEHALWVVFEDIILFYSIYLGRQDLMSQAKTQAQLESTLQNIEITVAARTKELTDAQTLVMEQQQTLLGATKMSALGEMAAGVAHEINNPLAVIKNISAQISEVLAEPVVDLKLVITMSTKVQKGVDRIAAIIQGLRTFSRDGENDPFKETNIDSLLQETLVLCRERLNAHQIELRVKDFDKSMRFDCRATQISQVILNLIGNAHDAILALPEKWIAIDVQEREDTIEIRIVDSGAGIGVDIGKKIFQPFFTTKEVGKGTGLGLSISHGIVRAHAGNLFIDHRAKNTSFVIQIPIKQPTNKSERAA